MAYFSHAFEQTFILRAALVTSGNPSTLLPGNGGFFNAKTWNAVPLAQASVMQHPKVVFAVGSHRSAATAGDTLGSHGGYRETLKSRVIDPNYVHRFWKVTGRAVQQHIVQVGWDGLNSATVPKFYCGQTYRLRIDVKGSPALRFLDHTISHTFDVRTACCTGTTPELVDPVQVLLAFAKQISESPIVSKFIATTVRDFNGVVNANTYVPATSQSAIESVLAGLRLTAGYSDTQFSSFSFDPLDHAELEPVVISSVQLVDDTGDPCSLFKQLAYKELAAPRAAQGNGTTVLREYLLGNEYRHDLSFSLDARKRDLLDFSFIVSTLAPPNFAYHSYYILYSTPRNYNPSGTYDNDLCLLRICTSTAGLLAGLETWFTTYLASTGSGVTLENVL